MKKFNVQVQYLHHSSFSVETANCQMIFDYYKGPVRLGNKRIIVFSSHSHPDHYNRKIFAWQKEHPGIRYILSNDITLEEPVSGIISMGPYEDAELEDIKVKTFGSTDLGVSFLVACEGINVFHAGDLNWWHWWEDTAEGIAQAEKDFKREIARIKGEKIDLAFFPVDPRLEHNSAIGAEYFIKEVEPRILIPMHFWEDQQLIRKFAGQGRDRSTKVIALTTPGQTITL